MQLTLEIKLIIDRWHLKLTLNILAHSNYQKYRSQFDSQHYFSYQYLVYCS